MQQVKEQVSIPMATFNPLPEPFAPGYSAPYTPQPYAPQSYTPETYMPDPYLPKSCGQDPYADTSDGCCYDCPSPPPYSCEDVPCDRIGVISPDNSPPVVVAGIFSSKPASTICPACRQIITTEVVYRVGSLTYAVCTGICLIGCCLGCCLIPFMTNCCKDVDHYCPCCQYHIYRYKRL